MEYETKRAINMRLMEIADMLWMPAFSDDEKRKLSTEFDELVKLREKI